MSGKDEAGFDYPSLESVINDVPEVLSMSGEVGSWYGYRYDSSKNVIHVSGYNDNGDVEKRFVMKFTIQEDD